MNEVWKDIPNYEGYYQVSNLGRVKAIRFRNGNVNLPKERILTNKTTGKYHHIILCKDNKIKNFTIHKLVAQAFIPNPNNYKEINHKNENVADNRVENLEWCDHKYNINYGNRTKKVIDKMSIKILQYDLEGNFIKEWDSVNDAARKYNNRHICDVLKGNRKTASGYIWKYKEE